MLQIETMFIYLYRQIRHTNMACSQTFASPYQRLQQGAGWDSTSCESGSKLPRSQKAYNPNMIRILFNKYVNIIYVYITFVYIYIYVSKYNDFQIENAYIYI